jgi:hypothetical protein
MTDYLKRLKLAMQQPVEVPRPTFDRWPATKALLDGLDQGLDLTAASAAAYYESRLRFGRAHPFESRKPPLPVLRVPNRMRG